MVGFNAGVNISLGDMEIALDYLQDKDIYREELDEVRHKRVGVLGQVEDSTIAVKDKVSEVKAKHAAEEEYLEFGDDEYEDEDLDDEEDEDLDFGDDEYEDEDEDEDLDDEEDDEDEDLDFGDDEYEDEDLYDEEDEELDFGDEDGLDFGDDEYEDEEDGGHVKEEVVLKEPVKSDRELELERRLAQFEKAEAERKEKERVESLKKERELALQESEKSKRREAELERKLVEAEKLLREREGIEKNSEVKHNNPSGTSGANNVNSSTRNDKSKQQRQLVSGDTTKRKVIEPNQIYIDYSKLEIEALWKEVRRFMIENGVASQLVSKNLVEKKFGALNIKKLYLKGYLIPFGSKLTIGK